MLHSDLLKALSSLPASLKAETVLLILGNGGKAEAAGIASLNLGYVSSDRLKSPIVLLTCLFFPTRADNLPLVLQESMACGTPMVSFKVGGVPDLVRPGITGYLHLRMSKISVTVLCNSWKITRSHGSTMSRDRLDEYLYNYRLSAMLSRQILQN